MNQNKNEIENNNNITEQEENNITSKYQYILLIQPLKVYV